MRGYGLQRNSPIRLSLNRDNYEGLIERHGQWVRWLRATKCTCVSDNGRPDINCAKCGGDGWLYGFQDKAKETCSVYCHGDNIIELPYSDATVTTVHDYMGLEYSIVAQYGKFAKIAGPRTPYNDEQMQATFVRPLIKILTDVPLAYQGAGCFEAKGLRVIGEKGIAQEQSTPVDIVSVESIENVTKSESYDPESYRRNFVFADAQPDFSDILVAKNVRYIEPFLFAIVGQQYSESDWKFLELVGGDASMTFPEWAGVGEGDIVTILANSQVGKIIIDKNSSGIDTIPVFYVDSIEYIQKGDAKYYQGEHFDAWGVNKVKWRNVAGIPKTGDSLFVLFRYFPTYRVVREFPNVRSSENQGLPRRVALKLLSTYGERKLI